MNVPRPTAADEAEFRALVPDHPDVVVKPMFGNLGAFVNGNMFLGLFGSRIGVKLADPDRKELLDAPDAGPFGPAERPMGGWVALPQAWRSPASPAHAWVARSLEYVASLPAKQPKQQVRPPKQPTRQQDQG